MGKWFNYSITYTMKLWERSGRNHERLRKNISNFRVGQDLFLSLTENPVTVKEKIRLSPQT